MLPELSKANRTFETGVLAMNGGSAHSLNARATLVLRESRQQKITRKKIRLIKHCPLIRLEKAIVSN